MNNLLLNLVRTRLARASWEEKRQIIALAGAIVDALRAGDADYARELMEGLELDERIIDTLIVHFCETAADANQIE